MHPHIVAKSMNMSDSSSHRDSCSLAVDLYLKSIKYQISFKSLLQILKISVSLCFAVQLHRLHVTTKLTFAFLLMY